MEKTPSEDENMPISSFPFNFLTKGCLINIVMFLLQKTENNDTL